MKIFAYFDSLDYAIIVVLLLAALGLIIFFSRKTKKSAPEDILTGHNFSLILGPVMIIISMAWIIYIENTVDSVAGILQPVSIMTSEPFVFLSIILFVAGMVVFIIGMHRQITINRMKQEGGLE